MRAMLRAIRFLYGLRAVPEDSPGSPASRAGPGPVPGPGGFSPGWFQWIVPLGLLVGVMLAVVVSFGLAWLTYQPGKLWMVVAPAMLIYWLGPGLARYMGWGRTWTSVRLGTRMNDLGHDDYPGVECLGLMVVAIVAAAVTQFVAVAMLPDHWQQAPAALEAWYTRLVRPTGAPAEVEARFLSFYYLLFPPTHYGAVVLMTLWGNAAVLLASCLGRPAGHADPMVRQLLAAPAWKKMAWALPVPAAVSMLFLAGWQPGQPGQGWQSWASMLVPSAFHALAIAVILFGVTMLFAWLLARRVQGHCRATLLAAGLIGEIAFLIVFHALVK